MSSEQNTKLQDLYQMARNAKASEDATTAKKYYDMILLENPVNWEPIFYSVYFSYPTTKNGEISNKANEIKNCLNTTLLSIGNIADSAEKKIALLEVMNSIVKVAGFLNSAAISFYNSLPLITKNPIEKIQRTILIADLLFVMGDGLKNNGLDSNATEIYKDAISLVETETVFSIPTNNMPPQYSQTLSRVEATADYIRKLNPSYMTKREMAKKNRENKKVGCYVATCVYGSYDCPQVWTLRRYRDDTLASKWYGRIFIKTYYAIGPTLVKWFGNTKWFKKMWQGKLDRMVKTLQENGVESTPYQDKVW